MRAAKLESARKMLKHHQEKKQVKYDNHDGNLPNVLIDSKENVENSTNVKCTNEIDIGDTVVELKEPIHDHLISAQIQSNQQNQLEEQFKAVEILTSNKRYLEMHVQELQNKILHIEGSYAEAIKNFNDYKTNQELSQKEILKIKETMNKQSQELLTKNQNLVEQSTLIASLSDKINDLTEQLEITKTALVAKETENASINSQLNNLQSELDLTQLHLQQLSNGGMVKTNPTSDRNIEEEYDTLLQKFTNLENKFKHVVNEKEQMRVHYEQYAAELSDQLNSVTKQHSELFKENNDLRDREYSMIEQMSETEIIIQQLRQAVANHTTTSQHQQDDEHKSLQVKYNDLEISFKNLEQEYNACKEEAKQMKSSLLEQENAAKFEPKIESNIAQDIDISKLHADITSDKIAAQMATTQNIQLKKEIEDLKEVYVKMSQDKLELTEKLDAEKFLNRQLTLKLSEYDEKLKDVNTKLMAKDKEMIRILSNYNDLETKFVQQSEHFNNLNKSEDIVSVENNDNSSSILNSDVSENNELLEKHRNMALVTEESNNALNISIKEGMLKLQDRFLRKMEELAELSDEKHRLEHIIMQLQCETDTICEYVALYQQQRGILIKREEERKEQLKFFEKERSRMQNQLDHLSSIISYFASDKDLEQYFKHGSRKQEVSKIINLVENLKTNHLIDPSKQCADLGGVYHCSWCSGKVIVV